MGLQAFACPSASTHASVLSSQEVASKVLQDLSGLEVASTSQRERVLEDRSKGILALKPLLHVCLTVLLKDATCEI